VVLDVPPVLAQVHGDGVGPGALGHQRGRHRVGLAATAGLAQRGDVVDIDAEQDWRGGLG
jgi:hypothetical protein